MTTPVNLDIDAFQTMMHAWIDEISTKQTENFNARIDKLKELNKNQTESLENKLEQQSETVSYTHLDVYKRQVIVNMKRRLEMKKK